MSRAGRPASTSSRSRWASARASARRCGLVSTPASPSRVSSSHPRESVHEQLDARHRAAGVAGIEQPQLAAVVVHLPVARQQRGEALGPLRRVGGVEDVEQLLARAEVRRQQPHAILAERGAALAEDRHVGVAEAVDRLELVADREQVVALERLEHVELEPVGVLELVDHDQREALRPALPVLGVGGEQVAHAELEVLEVEPRALRLGLRVARAEAREQHRDLLQRGAGVVVGAALAVGVERGAIGLARRLPERLGVLLELRGRERGRDRNAPVGQHALADVERRPALVEPDPGAGGQEIPRRRRARRGQLRRVGRRPGRRHAQHGPRLAARAQRRVDAEHDVLEARAVGRGDVDRRRPALARPLLERALVGLPREPLGGRLVEHVEARIEPRGERARAQDARAEAVDRADPARVDRARVLLLAERDEAPADAVAQLAGRLLGEGQGEDRADRHAVVQHRLDAALGHHRRLAGAGVGGEQRRARAIVDRLALLRGEGDAHPPARQIVG